MDKLRPLLILTLFGVAPHGLADAADSARLALGAGQIDLRRSTQHTALALMVEGRQLRSAWGLRPVAMAISGGNGSYYIGVGLLKEFPLDERWSAAIGLAAGDYDQGDSRRNLGNDLEFHSRITLDYKLNRRHTIRAELGHLSNAFLGDTNPGTELITLNWVATFN